MENYIINKDGSVWSNLSNKFLKPEKTASGYLRVELQGKKYPVNAKLPIPAHPRCRCCAIPVVQIPKINV